MDMHAQLDTFFAAQEKKSLLRFLTCGSVDDGKSTLIGRLLYDTQMLFEDQVAALESDSRKHGASGHDLDFTLLMDGLEAEREQGITIDVAYRFFTTTKRKFIVADSPGHEQFTRNMVTGASTAQLAIVLVDARRGLLPQTHRHSLIASLLGIRHVVLAVNKIDLVDYSERIFSGIAADYRSLAKELGFATITPIPTSARYGDNVAKRSRHMEWYSGPALLQHLETIDVVKDTEDQPFRFAIQYVNRPSADFRGLAGTVSSGSICEGSSVVVAKSGRPSRIKRIIGPRGELVCAQEGQSVTLLLDDDVEASRGNMLVAPGTPPHLADQFAANLVWFSEQPLLLGRSFLLRTETDESPATITDLKYRININNFAQEAAKSLAINEVGVVNVSTQTPIAFDTFQDNRATGSFILINRITNATVAAGMIQHPLRRAENIHWQELHVTKASRARLKAQRAAVLWFTGLSGSGKSTIANLVEKKLNAEGRHTYLLDGDNVRHGLNRDLGFTDQDRVENIRRLAEVAKLMADAGLLVLVSAISPFEAERRTARELLGDGEFVEIFVDTPFEECVRRDPKGLYAKAFRGEIKNFTGVDSPYEVPGAPDIHLKSEGRGASDLAIDVEDWLRERCYC
ncbi:sulfate adenylyltransferase subunit CysN [Rhizobium leguminosarum]|uniref:sulfate adenylyltransferase subunit CysN n=1 Tax=Rhizobium leguminosarum TaxID=384 RepID=UPI003F9B6EE9